MLFNYSFFKIFSKVRADFIRSFIGGYLGNVVLYHQLDKLLEAGLVRVPAQLSFCLSWIAPKVNNIGRAIEIRGNPYDYVAGLDG